MINLLPQLDIGLRLYFRNRMALLYGYLFPTLFLVAFAVLYRHEAVPLLRHMGELLTITALGGACFGLPTTMVSERERGVWRRFRLAPVATSQLVAGTLLTRYFLLLSAAGLQLALAMGLGMPLPEHLLDLWLAFTFVSIAFLGLGLVIAMLADNVPAVQALGQCIFLPMLVVGGVAVRLESLPLWAQHVSAFFPGRYAVEAIQVTVSGVGLAGARFSLVALLLTGIAGCIAGSKLFRWDVREKFADRKGKSWIAVALAAWVAVGLSAEATGRVTAGQRGPVQGMLALDESHAARPDTGLAAAPAQFADTVSAKGAPGTASRDAGGDALTEAEMPRDSAAAVEPGGRSIASAQEQSEPARAPASWRDVTAADIVRDLRFDGLPDDAGVIAPVATTRDRIDPGPADVLQCLRSRLGFWGPGQVSDPVQRTRNFLYVSAVPDMFQFEELERWVPIAVFDHLRYAVGDDRLVRILYWIAVHPGEGDTSAAGQLAAVCLDMGGPSDEETLRERTVIYALKLLGRITGDIPVG